ncbi:hypothetical protein V8B97DRAFT_2026677 [Scleroderma yunnanense]
MSDILTLHCLVLGDTPDRIFSVDIACTKNVYALKKAIKDKHAFYGVDTCELILYRTSEEVAMLDDDDLLQALSNSLGGHTKLFPLRLLSDIFKDAPPPKALHILVQPPLGSLRLNCLVLGDTPDHIFSVHIASRENIYALKAAIKDKKQYVFPAVELDLYHVSLPCDDELQHKLQDFNADKSLRPTSILRSIFIDVPAEDHLHIIVQRPFEGDLLGLLKDRTMYLANKLPAPSSGAEVFGTTQEKQNPVPVALMEPIFAQFLDDCQTYKPTEKDNRFVRKLSYQMSTFYSQEHWRMAQFRSELYDYGIVLEAAAIDSAIRTDGHLTVEDKFVVVIAEGKNEVGSGSGDPFAQALTYYHHFIRNMNGDNYRVARLCSVFPCFHIIVLGPCIGIVGSVFTKKIQSEILGPIIPLCWHSTQFAMKDMAARTFGALKIAIKKLKNMYSKPIPILSPGINLECPSWQKFTDPDGKSQEFTYDATQELRSNLIFFGELKTNPKRRICIKFVMRYSPDAHRFCASKGHAPELIAFEKLPGGWYMVIMEALDIYNGPLSQPINSYRPFYRHRAPDLKVLEEAVTAFIGDFHNEGYVHGDLRDVNLVVKDDGQFMLLDFDWAGKLHETYYPSNVNREGAHRPSGARDGMEILQDHDLEMLRFLFHLGM